MGSLFPSLCGGCGGPLEGKKSLICHPEPSIPESLHLGLPWCLAVCFLAICIPSNVSSKVIPPPHLTPRLLKLEAFVGPCNDLTEGSFRLNTGLSSRAPANRTVTTVLCVSQTCPRTPGNKPEVVPRCPAQFCAEPQWCQDVRSAWGSVLTTEKRPGVFLVAQGQPVLTPTEQR